MCISTISIQTPKGRVNVNCGSCPECLEQRRAQWTFRLLRELEQAKTAIFLTLTYSDDYYPLNHEKKNLRVPIQNFFKKIRRENERFVSDQVRYFLVCEFGEVDNRAHYHAIIFNLHSSVILRLDELWGQGMIYIGDVNQSSIHYTTKYVLKNLGGKSECFALMSKRPYLGSCYLTKEIVKYHRKQNQTSAQFMDGNKIALPRVYKKRIFATIERQVIAKDQNEQKVKKDRVKMLKKDYLKKERSKQYAKFLKTTNKSKSKKV